MTTPIRVTIRCIFCFVAVFLCSVHTLHAAGKSGNEADSYLRQGKDAYARKKMQVAMENFIKVLLLDPANTAAKEYLRRPAMDAQFLTDAEQYKMYKFLDLSDQVAFIRSRIEYVDGSNEGLISFLYKNDLVNVDNQEQIDSLQSLLVSNPAVPGLKDGSFQQATREGDLLSAVFKMMLALKESALNTLEEKQNVNKELRHLKMVLLENEKKQQRTVRLAAFDDDRLNVPEPQVDAEQEESMADQQERIDEMQGTIRNFQSRFDTVQERLRETDKRIVELTRQIAGLSLDLYNKEILLADKEEKVAVISGQLKESQQKLLLVQGLLQEKDQQIQGLEEQVAQLGSKFDAEPDDQKVPEAPVAAAGPDPDTGKLAELETKVADLTEKYAAMEKIVQDRESQVAQLNKLVEILDRKVVEYRQNQLKKEQELSRVRGVLEIYRGQLAETRSLLREKDDRLRSVEEQLHGLESLLELHSSQSVPARVPSLPIAQDQPSPLPRPLAAEVISNYNSRAIMDQTQHQVEILMQGFQKNIPDFNLP